MKNCIKWHGCVKNGYGWRTWLGETTTAHRIEYCKANGLRLEDIQGMIIRHKCDNPLCINPEHLVVGTQQQNVNDMHERHREFRKLSPENVDLLKAEYVRGSSTSGTAALAKKYGLSQPHVSQIVNGTALSGFSISDCISAFGEQKKISEWSKDPRCKVKAKTIIRRILSGLSAEEAICKQPARILRGKSCAA